MKVSIIMSVYNSEKFLEECIESIINQTYKDFEFIIVNDNSTDQTDAIIKKYMKEDKRIKYIINKENVGLTQNLNKALKIANGEYIARIDADDIAIETRLKKQVEFLDKNKDISIVGCLAQYIDENGKKEQIRNLPETNEEICRMMHKVNPILHPGVMFRKNDIIKIGGYDEKYRIVQDYSLWFKCMHEKLKFYNIQEVLMFFRRDSKYNKRKSKKYRKVDFKVRVEGYKLNNIPIYKWGYLMIPIILIIMPPALVDKTFYILKKIDPRNKVKNMGSV